MNEALDQLHALNLAAKGAGIAAASKPVPEGLAAVLRSHPMIHTPKPLYFGVR